MSLSTKTVEKLNNLMVNGPDYAGAPYPEYDPFKVNEEEFSKEERFKSYDFKADSETVTVDWESYEDNLMSQGFVQEITRAVEANMSLGESCIIKITQRSYYGGSAKHHEAQVTKTSYKSEYVDLDDLHYQGSDTIMEFVKHERDLIMSDPTPEEIKKSLEGMHRCSRGYQAEFIVYLAVAEACNYHELVEQYSNSEPWSIRLMELSGISEPNFCQVLEECRKSLKEVK